MTVKQAFDDAIKSYSKLVEAVGEYAKASTYDGKKDFKKWLGELNSATKEVEAAFAKAKGAAEELEKTLNAYVTANKDAIAKDREKQGAVDTVRESIKSINEGLQEIRNHLDKNKA